MEILDIVNEKDEIIGKMERQESYKKSAINRLVGVVIFNNQGKIALQKRSSKCSFLSGYWSLSAGGHVSSGESYLQAAQRELFEEIGVKCKITFKKKDFDDRLKINGDLNDSKKSHFFFQAIYEGIYNGDFKFDDGEVDEIKFFSLEELKKMIKSGADIMPGTVNVLEKYYLK